MLFKFCSPCQAELRGKWYSDYFNIWEEFFNDSFQLMWSMKWSIEIIAIFIFSSIK